MQNFPSKQQIPPLKPEDPSKKPENISSKILENPSLKSDRPDSQSALMMIFFKNTENELYGVLPLLSNLEVIELKPIIRKKLPLPKELAVFEILFNDLTLNDNKSLSSQGVTPFSDLVISVPVINGHISVIPDPLFQEKSQKIVSDHGFDESGNNNDTSISKKSTKTIHF